MVDNKTYRFPVDEEKARKLDIEYASTKSDMDLFLFPETEKYGKAFWGTMEEINEIPGGCPWNTLFGATVKYYREWFGKKNVIYYSDGKLDIIRAIEDGKIYIYDRWESRIEGKYIWNEACELPILDSCINEVSKRLDLKL